MTTWLPLETLPGWPEAPEVSTSWMLLLLLALPLVALAVIGLLTFAPRLSQRYRSESGEGREVARRADMSGPDAREVVQDAMARQDQPDVDAGDTAPRSTPA